MKKRVLSVVCASTLLLSGCFPLPQGGQEIDTDVTEEQTATLQENTADFIEYVPNIDGTCYVKGYRYFTNHPFTLEIPRYSPNGNLVTGIGNDAFRDRMFLTSIQIPDSVTYIGDSAFRNCTSLTTVNISHGVTYIGERAFENCTLLTSLTLPDSVEEIGEGAFYNCFRLSEVKLPSGLDKINARLFYQCISLKEITIPETVVQIGRRAFSGCVGLKKISISKSVNSIGAEAFREFSGDEIEVDTENSTYHTDGNCLIETATKRLILGCKNSVIPTDGSVEIIGEYAFWNCNGKFVLPKSIREIGACAFGFSGSSSFQFEYKGSQAAWNQISRHNNWVYSWKNENYVTVLCKNGYVTSKVTSDFNAKSDIPDMPDGK